MSSAFYTSLKRNVLAFLHLTSRTMICQHKQSKQVTNNPESSWSKMLCSSSSTAVCRLWSLRWREGKERRGSGERGSGWENGPVCASDSNGSFPVLLPPPSWLLLFLFLPLLRAPPVPQSSPASPG